MTCNRSFYPVAFQLLFKDLLDLRGKGSESIFHQPEFKATLAPVLPSASCTYLTGMTGLLSLLWCNKTWAIWVNPYVVPQVYWFIRCLWAAQTSCCAQHHKEEQIKPRQDVVCREKFNTHPACGFKSAAHGFNVSLAQWK